MEFVSTSGSGPLFYDTGRHIEGVQTHPAEIRAQQLAIWPMTWHAKALQTSYATPRRAGSKGGEEGDASYPFSTSSWFFPGRARCDGPAETPVIVAFGDSITDGTASPMNADDRWPDFLARRLLQLYEPNRAAVLNAGIGGTKWPVLPSIARQSPSLAEAVTSA